jgi:hypothetical protein
MTGLVRKATLLLSVCGLMVSAVAFANVPDPINSDFNKSNLNFSGHDGGFAGDAFSPFTVTVRDLANIPIQGSIVVIDVSLCNDIQFCSDQLSAVIGDCATHTLRQTTDALGQATFYLIGGALIDFNANPDGQACNCVKIYADGVNIVEPADEPVNAGVFDLDNDSGVGGGDLTLWIDDFGNPNFSTLGLLRSDLDHSNADCVTGGAVDGADLTIWLDDFGLGTGQGGSCNGLPGPPTKCTP